MDPIDDFDAEAAYAQLRALEKSKPVIMPGLSTPELHKWLGELYAVVKQFDRVRANEIRHAHDNLAADLLAKSAIQKILGIVYRSLAELELLLPAHSRGAFVAVGQSFAFFATVATMLREATKDVLVVDPYLDAVALTDFAPCAPEAVKLRLLADRHYLQASLAPACKRWKEERPGRVIECRVSGRRELHDRFIIIDGATVWDLSQSIKDFAGRSPGSISKFAADLAPDKIYHYERVWDSQNTRDISEFQGG